MANCPLRDTPPWLATISEETNAPEYNAVLLRENVTEKQDLSDHEIGHDPLIICSDDQEGIVSLWLCFIGYPQSQK